LILGLSSKNGLEIEGELHFPDLNITVEIKPDDPSFARTSSGRSPDDIIAFRSYELLHEVLAYTGERLWRLRRREPGKDLPSAKLCF
jgi:hypothetical protein